MRKLILAASAVFVLTTGTASAADMPLKAPPAPSLLVQTWAGFYAGINLGGNWGRSDESLDVTSSGSFFVAPFCFPPANTCVVNVVDVRNAGAQRFNTSGFTGGAQAGYNWQSGAFVAGIETDINYFRSAGSGTRTVPIVSGIVLGGVPGTVTVGENFSTNWLFTLRGRAGWAVNNWLFYGTGGLAVSDLRSGWTFHETSFGNVAAGSVSDTKAGWTVGAGVETKFAGGWSLGLEYLFVRFDHISSTVPIFLPLGSVGTLAAQNFFHTADLETNIVRAKLNYSFGAPVVAKY